MRKVIEVNAEPGFRLMLTFDDGTTGEVELESRLFGAVFEPLRDEGFFAQVNIDEYGVVCWPNGADLDPEALYERVLEGESQRLTRGNS